MTDVDRYTLVPSIDGEWGVRKSDGQYTGMIGMVQRNVSMWLVFLSPLISLCIYNTLLYSTFWRGKNVIIIKCNVIQE